MSVPESPSIPSPPVSEPPKVPVSISDLVIKEAKNIEQPPLPCIAVDSTSAWALSVVYEYKATWKFSQFTGTLPVYETQVTLTSKDAQEIAKIVENNSTTININLDSATTYQQIALDKLSPEVKGYTPGMVLNRDITNSYSRELIFRANCDAQTAKMTTPQSDEFTLTLSIDGQELSKEFVAK